MAPPWPSHSATSWPFTTWAVSASESPSSRRFRLTGRYGLSDRFSATQHLQFNSNSAFLAFYSNIAYGARGTDSLLVTTDKTATFWNLSTLTRKGYLYNGQAETKPSIESKSHVNQVQVPSSFCALSSNRGSAPRDTGHFPGRVQRCHVVCCGQ